MKTIFYFILVSCLVTGCRKFVTVDPPGDQIVNPEPFTNDATATATVTGIYSEMMNNTSQFSSAYTTLYAGMYADELYYYTPGSRDEFVAGNITEANHGLLNTSFWIPMYKYIYAANLAMEQLRLSTVLTASVKQRLSGEALFLRVFCYSYLVNFFGDVPLIVGSDYKINQSYARTNKEEVYGKMREDLDSAIKALPDNYPEGVRTRPNKWAARALLARIALYQKDYTTAATVATTIINGASFTLTSDLNSVFLKDSKEAIWQLQPVRTSYNTTEGNLILPASNATQPSYLITDRLVNAFETGDKRKDAWIKQRTYNSIILYYPYKYKIRTADAISENYVVLRLAEQYLVRAEANAQLGKMQEAIDDLNIIRNRAGLNNITVGTMNALLPAIEHERQIELCFEWGHRWFDLQRTGRAADVLAPIKPQWSDKDTLWPIPFNQINLNPSLTQNKGY